MTTAICFDQVVDMDVPRLIPASTSSFSHLPSCRTKVTNSQLGNQQSGTEITKLTKAPLNSRLESGTTRWSILPSSWWPHLLYWQSRLPNMTPILSEPWAFLRSSTFQNQSCPKQRERERPRTSSILCSGQKLRSWTSATLSLILNGSVSASLISPSSFGLSGRCDPKHHLTLETSYPGMEILNYVHVLTKGQGKGTWALTQKSCQGIWRLVSKESLCEGPLFQTNRELSQPYASIPRTPEHLQERINQKTLTITNLAHDFYPAT